MDFDPVSSEEVAAMTAEAELLARVKLPDWAPDVLVELLAAQMGEVRDSAVIAGQLVEVLDSEAGFHALLASNERVRDLYHRINTASAAIATLDLPPHQR
jgi:hypothetical protein